MRIKSWEQFNEGIFDKFSKTPNEKWSDRKLRHNLSKVMWDKYEEAGVAGTYIRPEGKKWEGVVKQTIEENYPFLSPEEKQQLLDWYMDENFFYKTEEPSKFEVGDEVYYFFNPIDHFKNASHKPRFYKDVVKSKNVGPDSWSYNFEKNKHDNTNPDGTVSRSGQYASMIDQEDMDFDLEALRKRVAQRVGDYQLVEKFELFQ